MCCLQVLTGCKTSRNFSVLVTNWGRVFGTRRIVLENGFRVVTKFPIHFERTLCTSARQYRISSPLRTRTPSNLYRPGISCLSHLMDCRKHRRISCLSNCRHLVPLSRRAIVAESLENNTQFNSRVFGLVRAMPEMYDDGLPI